MAAKAKSAAPLPPAQQLSAVIKAARDIMRKDKGLNGDLDRLPMLTWIMFLKFLDDKEQVWEAEAKVAGKSYRRLIEPPYRWRDWAGKDEGITGEDLISFISNEEAVRPDGIRGAGLFPYLRKLQGSNGGDRRDVIATVFKGTINRMVNGYLLRDVLNKVNQLHFTQSAETHVLSHLYESLLKEMRDSAGDSGEFYTPRPVVRFIVEAIDPHVGEAVLDPAAGTGGFLVEAFDHMMKSCKSTKDRETIQKSLYGIEAKPLPYLLCQMNLLLHGVEYPQIDPGNALRFPLQDIGDKDRVDVIVTNPPFGGEEERGILANFPEDKQTAETTLLFLQLIMRKLRRAGMGHDKSGGRCGMVVPNGTLFGSGVCAKIKEELLREFNLHTIVRLPGGVFAPYTSIPTNLLFFDRSGPTKEIWYYEHALPEGKKNYTKTQPLQFPEFRPCIEWWGSRTENERAWKIPVEDIIKGGYNLDCKNPRGGSEFEQMAPSQIIESVVTKEKSALARVTELQGTLAGGSNFEKWPAVQLGKTLRYRKEFILIDDLAIYKRCRVQLHAQGIVLRDEVLGSEIKTKQQQVCRAGELLVAEIDAKVGGYGIVPDGLEGAIVSSHYFLFEIDEALLDRRFLGYFIRTPEFQAQVAAQGSTNYAAIRPQNVLAYQIPLPPLAEQKRIISIAEKIEDAAILRRTLAKELDGLLMSVLKNACAVSGKSGIRD